MSGKNQHPNYEEREDGYYKKDHSQVRGSADYFSRPAPPVRDGETGHPIGSDGKTDWARVIREVNERDGR